MRAGENADCCVGLQKAKLSVSKRFGRRTVEIVKNNREISFNNATRFQRLLEPEWVGHITNRPYPPKGKETSLFPFHYDRI